MRFQYVLVVLITILVGSGPAISEIRGSSPSLAISVTPDELFGNTSFILNKYVTIRRANCVLLGDFEAKDTLCEAKTRGGRSVFFYATTALWDNDEEYSAAKYFERMCSGTANLGNSRCFFQVTAEVRLIGPTQMRNSDIGTIAVREVNAGPARLLRR
jgi:hypothetical protein